MTGTSARDDRRRELQALVRIPTVSHRDPDRIDTAAFDAFVAELERQFPLLHERLELTRVHTHGLLFHWPGRAADRPVVLMAHLDVVPVDEDAPWQHPPFAAEIVDGAIWGRGTLDDKGCLVAICEAVESCSTTASRPAQDVWLSFGCDEEVFGHAAPDGGRGARAARRPPVVRPRRGRRDRVTRRSPASTRRSASIGVTEKGVTSLELAVEGRGGHASTPARNGPTARLARAIAAARPHAVPGQHAGPDPRADAAARAARTRGRCAR